MARALDVAAFIKAELGSTTSMQRQKLLYYSQAWSLAWSGAPLFDEAIEAWDDGPVVRSVWGLEKHTGAVGDPSKLTHDEQETVREVLRVYGKHDGDWLSALSHREPPWCDARAKAPPGRPCRERITPEAMKSYFGMMSTDGKHLPAELERGWNLLVSLPPDEAANLLNTTEEDGTEFLQSLESQP